MYTRVRVCMCVYTCIRLHVQVCACMYMRIYLYTRVRVCMCVYTCIRVLTRSMGAVATGVNNIYT
jgi:hypothetical protein